MWRRPLAPPKPSHLASGAGHPHIRDSIRGTTSASRVAGSPPRSACNPASASSPSRRDCRRGKRFNRCPRRFSGCRRLARSSCWGCGRSNPGRWPGRSPAGAGTCPRPPHPLRKATPCATPPSRAWVSPGPVHCMRSKSWVKTPTCSSRWPGRFRAICSKSSANVPPWSRNSCARCGACPPNASPKSPAGFAMATGDSFPEVGNAKLKGIVEVRR